MTALQLLLALGLPDAEKPRWCNAGCQLSSRPCRVPCSVIGEIDRRALVAYHRERIVWVLRRKGHNDRAAAPARWLARIEKTLWAPVPRKP